MGLLEHYFLINTFDMVTGLGKEDNWRKMLLHSFIDG
jgi:hypothetical protein